MNINERFRIRPLLVSLASDLYALAISQQNVRIGTNPHNTLSYLYNAFFKLRLHEKPIIPNRSLENPFRGQARKHLIISMMKIAFSNDRH